MIYILLYKMISIFTFSKTLPVRKTTKNLTSKRLPYFRLTPPASFTLIGRVCHSSESFAKNEQRLLFSPTNLCQVRLVSLIYSIFCLFFTSNFLLGFSGSNSLTNSKHCTQDLIFFTTFLRF